MIVKILNNVIRCDRFYALRSLLLVCATQMFSANAMAAAGDAVSTRAIINYTYNTINFVQESSPTGNTRIGAGNGADTVFTEDRAINFTVSETDNVATGVNSGESQVVTTFTVANLGNDVQDFLLFAANNSSHSLATTQIDNIDALLPLRAFVESGANSGYQPGEDIADYIDELQTGAANAATVYIVADMPVAAPDDLAAVTLVVQVAAGGAAGQGAAINADSNGNISPAGTYSNGAVNVPAGTASTDPDVSGEDVVFNEPGAANTEDFDSSAATTDLPRNGQHSATDAYLIEPSEVVVNKSVTVIDTLGGSDPHAGSTLRYQLDVNVTGVGTVDNLVITDAVPANTTYLPGSITLDAVPQTDADDDGIPSGTVVDYSQLTGVPGSQSITVDLGQGGTNTITPPATFIIIFEVTID